MEYHASVFRFCCTLMTGSSVIMYVSERTFVLPVALQLEHFTEFLDEFSPDVLGQLLNDPFLSEKNEIMEVELSPASPAPLIQAEHSYSLCGDSRPQSPLTHISTDDNFNEECFIREEEEEEEELFLMFGILFNLNPGIMFMAFSYLLTSNQ
ncbi:hypothetical protein BTVI_81738 [Pitangus sulphuratus]|nr:hypothetical protein BTVI_81738 [Pitangus sulphuratus]